jgi:hypothetical protein
VLSWEASLQTRRGIIKLWKDTHLAEQNFKVAAVVGGLGFGKP